MAKILWKQQAPVETTKSRSLLTVPLTHCELVMINFSQFWAEGNRPRQDSGKTPSAAGDGESRGVTADQIRDWERRHGVNLPEPLRTALRIRNGGPVRNTAFEIVPLEEIVPVDDDFWNHTEIDEDEAPDHALVFVFGAETQCGGTLIANFNANGPRGCPSVYIDFHGESTEQLDESLADFFESVLISSESPSVDWLELSRSRAAIITRESIDLAALHGKQPSSLEQVLAQVGECLILLTREQSPEGTILTRTVLPLPLDPEAAEIEPYRPAPITTFGLHLEPTDNEGIVHTQSEMHDDGRWKNSTTEGVPIYVTLESTDRGRLESLRSQLFGQHGAALAQASEDQQQALAETLGKLSPDQRTAALGQMAMAMKQEIDRQFTAQLGDLGSAPPEIAAAAEAIRGKIEEMAKQAAQQAAEKPADPDAMRRLEQLIRKGWK